jgi:hypothetical protein
MRVPGSCFCLAGSDKPRRLQSDVLLRTVLKYCDRGEFPTYKDITFALKEKKVTYKGSVSSITGLLKHLGFQCEKLMMEVNSSWSEVTLFGQC